MNDNHKTCQTYHVLSLKDQYFLKSEFLKIFFKKLNGIHGYKVLAIFNVDI